MKQVEFLGDTRETVRRWGKEVKERVGIELYRLQQGKNPTDFKPMKDVGSGVSEIRIKHNGQFRVIYTAKFQNTIYVLGAFQKKTQKTPKQELENVRNRLKLI